MFPDINAFIAELERRKELARITDSLSPDLEISALIDRACKSPGGGPALLFEKPTGASMPVAANLFGSMSRICLALGVDTDALGIDVARDISRAITDSSAHASSSTCEGTPAAELAACGL